MRYKRLPCPRCAAIQKHTKFVRQVTDSNIPFNEYLKYPYYVDTGDSKPMPLLYRLACTGCGFAGYTTDSLDRNKLAKRWNDAVIDYERNCYSSPARVFLWLNIKQTYKPRKKKKVKRDEQTDLLS